MEPPVPLTRIDLKRGKSAAYRKAVLDGVYEALRETFDVPEDDRFVLVTEHGNDGLLYGSHYLGIERSDDLVIIQLTVNDTRGLEQKKALYKRIVDRLAANPGLRPEDVLINLVEVAKENWSFGNGAAQYA
jgi:phenylpyruvate tautomerase PptA (4-oxalocrotonate tautomerase family)